MARHEKTEKENTDQKKPEAFFRNEGDHRAKNNKIVTDKEGYGFHDLMTNRNSIYHDRVIT